MIQYRGHFGYSRNFSRIFIIKRVHRTPVASPKMWYLPTSEKNCASRMLSIKGRESSTVYVSDEKRLRMRPVGVLSKNFIFA